MNDKNLISLNELNKQINRPKPYRRKHKTGQKNKLESNYESEVLFPRRINGEVIKWSFESIGFRLADKTFYYPDYYVVCPECIEIHEVKGFWEDDAVVKWKWFVKEHPELKCITAQKKKGKWDIKEW